jgi:exopolysaccharide biosynthesis polyprenyl glycosylphosphotransferase
MTPQTATNLRPRSAETLGPIADGPTSVTLPGTAHLPAPVPLRPSNAASAISVSDAPVRGDFPARRFTHKRWVEVADGVGAALAVAVSLSLFGAKGIIGLAIVSVPLSLVVFKAGGLQRHDVRIAPSTLDEAPAILQLTGLFALVIGLLQSLVSRAGIDTAQVAGVWLVAFVLVVAGRAIARSLIRRVAPPERCLIVGDLDQAGRISGKLAACRAPAVVVGCLPLAQHAHEIWSPAAIRQVVAEMDAHRIIVFPSTQGDEGIAEFIRVARAAGVHVSVVPGMFTVVGSRVAFEDVDGMTMLAVHRFGLPRSARLFKRAFDVAVSGLSLVVLGPIIAAIALAIRLDSHGPVFFRQVRVGRDGRHFRIFKFRSMVADAEARKSELRLLNEAGDGLFKIANDPRVTRVGAFLRRSSLDELPQIFNVLRGDMSLVGPRPLVTDEDAQIVGVDRSRLHLTPGMTGPWQVLGIRVPLQEMVAIDYVYVANWSLWQDLKIMLRTVVHVVRRGNV